MKPSFLFVTLAACSIVSAHPGHTDEHRPQPNKPNVVAVVYSDFHCAPCAEVSGLIDRLINEKDLPIRTLFKHAPSKQSSLEAHEASLAAAQQGKFWEMHDLLFQNREANYSAILKMAKSLGLEMSQFQTGLDERLFRSRVVSELTEATGMGVKMTPTIFINGQKYEGIDQFHSFVESVLAPPKDPMDPDKDYQFDLAGSPATGPEDAAVTIVEFSDFRCGFCTVNSHTLSEVEKLYPGKIRRVFKHFPISINASGMLPHRASMAAMVQGKFWEMHEALMTSSATGSEDIVQRATAIGLDMDAFRSALTSSESATIVQRDITEGDQLGIRSTPTTFINGRYVSGRQSMESYRKLIDDLLGEESKAPVTPALVMGPKNASAWIDFYVDFAGPEVMDMVDVLNEFREERADTRIHLKPILTNSEVTNTHEALLAAAEQGKFWQLCELIVAHDSPPNHAQLLAFAQQLELDTTSFAAALIDHRHLKALLAEASQYEQRGLERSALFLNGERFEKELTARNLATFMDEHTCCGKTLPIAQMP